MSSVLSSILERMPRRLVLGDGVAAVVAAAAAVGIRIGAATDFKDSRFIIWLDPEPITLTWHSLTLAIIGFAALFALVNAICVAWRPVEFASLQSVGRSAIAAGMGTMMAAAVFAVIRPPNFPLSVVAFSGALAFAGWASIRLFALWRQIQTGTKSWKTEAAAAPITVSAALVAAGILLALVSIEAFLRIYNPFGIRIRGDQLALPANIHMRMVNAAPGERLEPEIVWRRNSLGFRGPEPPVPFDNHLTLVTVGGSTTEEFYISDGKTWTSIVSELLTPRFSDLWINNAGLLGHSTYGHFLLIGDLLSKLRPKVVLFLVGINDLAIRPGGSLDIDTRYLRSRRIRSLLDWSADYSELSNVLFTTIRHFEAVQLGYATFFTSFEDFQRLPLPSNFIGADSNGPAIARIVDQQLPGYRARLQRLIAAVRAFGGEPVFMTQPLLWGDAVDPVSGRDLGRLTDFVHGMETTSLEVWRALERHNDVLRDVANINSVLLIDLARVMPKDGRLYIDRIHFSLAGSAFVGNYVARSLCPMLKADWPAFTRPTSCP